MNIAIIGAGLSGLSLAWHLLANGKCTVTLFDSHGIGGGASGIAAGLMHPYPGQMGMRSFLASEGLDATSMLLQIAQEKSEVALYNDKGIIRYAQNEQMRSLFLSHAKVFGDVEPYGENGFLIHSGMTIFCRPYLEALWRACEEKGAVLSRQKIDDLGVLSSYDAVVLAAGAGNFAFPEVQHLRLERLKGQILKCRIPEEIVFPERSLIGKGYIAKAQKEGFCYIGSTYERGSLSEVPDLDKAKAELIPKAILIHPQADAFPIIDCQAALRVMRIGHYYPMAGKLIDKLWITTALGSRGLLYHGLVAERLSEAILKEDLSALPSEFHLSCVVT
jgi:glycine/D-amino acid oxidase-like deaminating enzyme